MKHLFFALIFAVAATTNDAQETSSTVTRRKDVSDADSCVLQAKEEFASWLSTHPYQKDKHKINLKLLCGREFGESSNWLPENKITTGGSGADILVPFPPFKKMHCLYGAQPGHPMGWCHFGRCSMVKPDDLTIRGDYANEAILLKDRIEQLFGITMIPLRKGKGFEYNDGYDKVIIKLDSKSYQGTQTNIYPLVVDVYDLELERQSHKIQGIYQNLKKKYDANEIKPTIPSGEAGDIGLSGSDSTVWESSEVGGKEQIIFLPCRSESAGTRGRLHWRPFKITPDGRIFSIGAEDSYTKYWANPL